MIGDWEEVFDWTKSNGRATAKTVANIVKNFNAQEFLPPAIIGHKSSYPKDTRIAAGALVKAVKADDAGQKLFVQYEWPEKINVPIPEPYQRLVGMSEFFREAVNKKLYVTRSIGVGVKKDGSEFLEHIGYLGAQLPEIKGMPMHEFQALPTEAQSRFVEYNEATEFTEYDNTMKDYSNVKFPETVKPATRLKMLKAFLSPEFKANDPNDTLIATLQDLWDMEDASVEELVGVAKKLLAQQEDDEAATAGAAAALAAKAGYFGQFTKPEDLREFASALGAMIGESVKASIKPINARLDAFELKQKEFAESGGPTPPAPDPNAGGGAAAGGGASLAPAPVSLGLTQDAVTQAVQTATNTLTNSKNWIPAFDTTLTPLMSILANTKNGETGSCLDQLVTALSAVEGLAEMTELSNIIEYAGIKQRVEEMKEAAPTPAVSLPEGRPTQNGDITLKVTEYMQTHPGTSYVQASELLGY